MKKESIAAEKSLAEEVIQLGDGKNLVRRRVDIVLDASKFKIGWIENHVATTPILITRLSDASDIDHRLGFSQTVFVVEGIRCEECVVWGEDSGCVRVALKAIRLDHVEEFFHFATIVDVVGKNILVDRLANGSMDVENFVLSIDAREFHQIEDPFACILWIVAFLDLLSGPKNRTLGRSAEPLGVIDGTVVVIADDANIHLHHKIETLAGVWTVSDDIP